MSCERWVEAVLSGHKIERGEALELAKKNTEALADGASRIRRAFCEDSFELCTIISGKGGECSEDCAYCAQSVHHRAKAAVFGLISEKTAVDSAESNDASGVRRFSIVTSGKTLSEKEVGEVCALYRAISEAVPMALCASHGLLDEPQLRALKSAGVSRYHNNLETSEGFFKKICTTHTYAEKIETIRAAKAAGLSVCSGGIIGLGETMADRIDLALTLRDLAVDSVPINILNPIAGTPLEKNTPLGYDEIVKTIALFRFILPKTTLRLAGGRALMPDKGRRAIEAGINAAISGDMLTTAGISTGEDLEMLGDLGFVCGEEV